MIMKVVLSFLLIQFVISLKASKQVQFESEQLENTSVQQSESDKFFEQLLKADKNNNFNFIVDKIMSLENTVQQQKEELQDDLEANQNQIQKVSQYQGYLKKQEEINYQLQSILETLPKMDNNLIIKKLVLKIGQLSEHNEKEQERNRFLEERITNLTKIMNMKDVQLENMGNTMNQQNRLKNAQLQKQIEMQEENDKQMMDQQQQIQEQQLKTQQTQDEIQKKQDIILSKIKLEKLGKFRRDRVNAYGIRLKKSNDQIVKQIQQEHQISNVTDKPVQAVDQGYRNKTQYSVQQLLKQEKKTAEQAKIPNEVELQNTIEKNNQILKSIQKEKQEISQFQNNNQQNGVDSVQEADVVQNLDDVNGVFEKKYNLKIENFTGNADTVIQRQASQYHRNNNDFHNYHTVQYLPEGTLSNKSKKIQMPQEQNQTQQQDNSIQEFEKIQQNQFQQLLNKMQQYNNQYQQNYLAGNDPGFITRLLQSYTNNLQNAANSQPSSNDVQNMQTDNYQNNNQNSPSYNIQDSLQQYPQQNLNYDNQQMMNRINDEIPIEQSYQYGQN